MNATLKHTIIAEVENLIDYSCATPETETSNYSAFHQALLKKHFEAETVVLDAEENIVSLEMANEDGTPKVRHINVNFKKLGEFLKSCIQKDRNSLRFYKNLLRYYHTIQPLSA